MLYQRVSANYRATPSSSFSTSSLLAASLKRGGQRKETTAELERLHVLMHRAASELHAGGIAKMQRLWSVCFSRINEGCSLKRKKFLFRPRLIKITVAVSPAKVARYELFPLGRCVATPDLPVF